MLPTEEEMEVDDCWDKCYAGFFRAWNYVAMLLWGGLGVVFYMFRQQQLDGRDCPQPWGIFFFVDVSIQFVYYFLAAVSDCFNDKYGDTRRPGQLLHLFRMCCCLPISLAWWIVGIVWLLFDFDCMQFDAKPPKLWPFFFSAAGCTYCILCIQCCALNSFRKQVVSVETAEVPMEKQPVAASRSVQRWSRVVGIRPIGHDALVGFGAAERYRRTKRDLEEGYKLYKLKKRKRRGVRNVTVKHKPTLQELEEEEIQERMAGHQPVFPFMRATHTIRQKDVKLDDPFRHLAASSTDLAAADKAARVVALAAARVAKRQGEHAIGVPARRNL